MLNTKSSKKETTKFSLLAGKKLIILSIVLLTTLSATLFDNSYEPAKKEKSINTVTENTFEKDMEIVKKLKLFNAKDYLKDYEHKKKAKEILNESMKRFELTHTK